MCLYTRIRYYLQKRPFIVRIIIGGQLTRNGIPAGPSLEGSAELRPLDEWPKPCRRPDTLFDRTKSVSFRPEWRPSIRYAGRYLSGRTAAFIVRSYFILLFFKTNKIISKDYSSRSKRKRPKRVTSQPDFPTAAYIFSVRFYLS